MLDDSEGEFAGIGAELTREDGHPKVIAPIEDTPAARAGIKPGDVILKIDGKVTDGMSLKDVVDQLRGPAGSTVTITIGRRNRQALRRDADPRRHPRRLGQVAARAGRRSAMPASPPSPTRRSANSWRRSTRNEHARPAASSTASCSICATIPAGCSTRRCDIAGDFLDGGVVVSTRGRDADDNRDLSRRRRTATASRACRWWC